MKNFKTLVILDWDDTLFPTSWVVKNSIDLNKQEVQRKYIDLFVKLDSLIFNLLKNFLKYGKVVVVTNAMVKWVKISSAILPNTQKLINETIDIISARDMYQKKMPGNMFAWKKLIFEQLVMEHFMNKHRVENIISVGDADYEFQALVDLYENFKKKKRILKAVKFLSSPTYESLIDQLEVLNKSIHKVCTSKSHMDLKFRDM